MPQINAVAVIQISLLLSALPAQYLICKWTGSNVAQQQRATRRLLSTWNNFRTSYLNLDAWLDWLRHWVSKFTSTAASEEDDPQGESPALEVLLFQNEKEYFGGSADIRSPRDPAVLYRVGQVVREKDKEMIGVIVGWDERLKAPPEWTAKMYSDKKHLEDVPHYKVIFNGPNPKAILVGYIPQTALEGVTGIKPDIPTLDSYFTHFDGERFIMQAWLKALYPHD
ncbi:hypothetical protein EOD39_5010 [Acipenser ruthenus]|uniref:Hemimethylated DNA-binding domain-containing protein n=1 Tax=Acipenser ruthenus TaxID=7906 RepID=A0A444UFX4_ACIRT|nr:uncharacterized protein si:dkey-261l7.2 isoform X1 [Acipenser ruthenus]XP_033872963.1 uncharacterized protein si:dkey-261l7.2 isoform X1 [Acipenser ruthenus]XP_033872964.1 uncharacterized protein si:dkey-261l7.2 isoform X1 [Acipenser ruthenus]XP_033872965.1 uncharacterized protein si:dkey-261l7.2 isoform X1 [Acipenser ruthenus]XP_033872966.1 uncharacterized protein si:dkey-261l7.2 isoform X1 [Acipenser ruthenus]XP_033872967.1 uncharacterized protein si:dkey-261l7.2 isoform X1 [Acipenser rut